MEMISDRELLKQLRDTYHKFGHVPTTEEFDRCIGKARAALLVARFGSFGEACRKVGLIPPAQSVPHARQYSDEQVLAAYKRIRRQVGGPPTTHDWLRLKNRSEPTATCLTNRHGGIWSKVVDDLEAQLPQRRSFFG
jgi:hypothetical protein